ncbi:Sorting nexin-8 [Nymphon striatum]|nr:Sorting nexin-8 [Nymphon striatum]
MAVDFAFGSVPSFYREVYDILCPDETQQIDQDMFVKLLVKSSLPKATLLSIWEIIDAGQGYLTRAGLYKALALTSLAQQGKQVNEKLLQNLYGEELPKPALGDLSDLKYLSAKVKRDKNPARLGMNYVDVCDIDTITVEMVPEKKGLFLKHFEYEVSSTRSKSVVKRRYNDFVALFEVLLLRYPYRIIPRLPPKKVNTDAQFREERRRSLKRFLTLVCRHPVISEDRIITYFLTYSGSDCQTKIRDQFRGFPDEYMTSDHALDAKDFVPIDTQAQFINCKEQMKAIYNCVAQMRAAVERMAIRSQDSAADMLIISKELSNLSNKPHPESSWGTGGVETWEILKTSFRSLNPHMNKLSEMLLQQSAVQEDDVIEMFDLFLDLMIAYKDLCDRHDRGVLGDHQRAMSKMVNMSKRKSSNKGDQGNMDTNLESRILEQEQELANMENRSYFSLHCIHTETQLVHVYMETLSVAFKNLVLVQKGSHKDLLSAWEEILPFTEAMSSAPTTPGSPLPSPSTENYPKFPIK